MNRGFMRNNNLTCVGVITSAYHLRGLVKIKTFTANPENICSLRCQDESGKIVKIEKASVPHTYRIDGINDRTMAEKMIGTKIYVNRTDLPKIVSDDEFYIDELQNVPVFNIDNVQVGHVGGCFNFGAGDILEIVFADGREEMFLFTRENFPEVDRKRVVISRMDID
jgi:16S rRNA processing protein RimM